MKRKNRVRSRLMKIGLAVLIAVLTFSLCALRMDISDLNQKKADLDKEIKKQQKTIEVTKEDLKKGLTDEDIARIARDVLGYAYPGEKVYIDSSEQ